MSLQTEYTFTLPRGFMDGEGELHRHGRIRLALALDEIEAMGDPRVQTNPSFLPLVLLSRVITQLGNITAVTPTIIANLFASDLVYLEDLYLQLNSAAGVTLTAVCPTCKTSAALQAVPVE